MYHLKENKSNYSFRERKKNLYKNSIKKTFKMQFDLNNYIKIQKSKNI